MATKTSRKAPAKKRAVVRKATPRKAAVRKTAPRKPATGRKSAARNSKPARPARKPATRRAAKAVRKPAVQAAKKRTAKKKDGRPAGANWPALSPYLTVRDAAESLDFYANAFGFEIEGMVMRDEQGRVLHAGMRLGDACIMFAPQGMSNEMRAPAASGAPDSLSIYIYVPDIDALAARAQEVGALMLQEPADQFWGDRIAIFKDPDGYHWTFATNVGEFDASQAP